MPLHSTLSRNSDTVLMVSTGGSTTALSTYLRLLVAGCVGSGALFVAGTSSDSHEFDGVALWGPPSDDWVPWCVPHAPRFLLTSPLPWLTQGRGGVPVSATARKERLDNPPRRSSLSYTLAELQA